MGIYEPKNGLLYPVYQDDYRRRGIMLPEGYEPQETHGFIGATFLQSTGRDTLEVLEQVLGITPVHANVGVGAIRSAGGLENILATYGSAVSAMGNETLKTLVKRHPYALPITVGLALDTMLNNGELTKSLNRLVRSGADTIVQTVTTFMDVADWVTKDEGFSGFDLDRLQRFITDGVVGEPTLETFPVDDDTLGIKLTTPVLDEGEIRDSIILMQVTQKDIEFADRARLGEMKPADNGQGVRWDQDKRHKIRIMNGKGDDAPYESQREDYVKIVRDGEMRDKEGNPIPETDEYGKPSNHPDAHIKKTEWRKWAHPLHPTDLTGGMK